MIPSLLVHLIFYWSLIFRVRSTNDIHFSLHFID